MVLTNVTMKLSELTVAEGLEATQNLIFYIIAIVIYAMFIFKFYRFLGARDIFKLNLHRYSEGIMGAFGKLMDVVMYTLEYLLLLPLFAFFWFAIISALLIFMTQNQSVSTILMMSMALVAAIRITAYYNEDLSRDLAKMIPFALLGVFLVDMSFFNPMSSLQMLKEIPGMWVTLIYYLILFVIIEFLLRIVRMFFMLLYPGALEEAEAKQKK